MTIVVRVEIMKGREMLDVKNNISRPANEQVQNVTTTKREANLLNKLQRINTRKESAIILVMRLISIPVDIWGVEFTGENNVVEVVDEKSKDTEEGKQIRSGHTVRTFYEGCKNR